ncbi:ketosteroid isomerase-related protein [Hyphomonas sp.]|uniref:ketosteroid isomerase-related protein n=1 Tax=Hyphomonas sp. TaxID=87 RepID=UPI003919B4C0
MTTRDLVSRYYAAFNAKDWTAMAGCVAEDIDHFVNEGDKRGGRKAFADFIAHMDDCYDETLTDIVVMSSADGARAAAEFIVNGTYKKTDAGLPDARGQKYRLPAGAFFDVKDGAITRVTTYYNLKEWIRQVS